MPLLAKAWRTDSAHNDGRSLIVTVVMRARGAADLNPHPRGVGARSLSGSVGALPTLSIMRSQLSTILVICFI